ncbi:MAG: terminase small subunit [Streptococcus hyointestinalis]|uniref:terminase small subunit n=1 Tax=Streptococcus hyointestinalis TaxID=1337 RepID=UPI0023F284DC|nr:terminase small subunit [Streptococcus hyointestinalis]MDD7356629.1 terminase small subunit [Streptococcus hyointestinalis]MDY4553732.1 terminase small subunit [Streptococcus hyointestinalis]
MAKLTPKQELFVQGIIAGLSQRQAYRKAYPSAKRWQDNVVDNRASELLKNGEVLVRYRELLKQFSNMSLWSREQAFNEYEWLKNKAKQAIENEGVKQANANAFLAAVDGMNNMAFKELELEDKKLVREIELLQAKLDAIKGSKPDTSLMEALLDAVEGDDK